MRTAFPKMICYLGKFPQIRAEFFLEVMGEIWTRVLVPESGEHALCLMKTMHVEHQLGIL